MMGAKSSQYGSVIETLSDTLNHSDLLIAHPRPSERNDAEQFLHLVETQSLEVGGDPILLADRISHLADVAGNDLTSAGQSSSDSVQIMTIHGSKGLQRKCVIVGGLFSEGQGNISHDLIELGEDVLSGVVPVGNYTNRVGIYILLL